MKVKLYQHTGETKWKMEISQTNSLSGWQHHSKPVTSLQFTFLQTPVQWHFLLITPASLLVSGLICRVKNYSVLFCLWEGISRAAAMLITISADFGRSGLSWKREALRTALGTGQPRGGTLGFHCRASLFQEQVIREKQADLQWSYVKHHSS